MMPLGAMNQALLRKVGLGLLLAGLVVVIEMRYAEPIGDGDLFWHFAYAQQMLEARTLIPDPTLYSWTPAQPSDDLLRVVGRTRSLRTVERVRNGGTVRVALSGRRRDRRTLLVDDQARAIRRRSMDAVGDAAADRDRVPWIADQAGTLLALAVSRRALVLLPRQIGCARRGRSASMVLRCSAADVVVGKYAWRACAPRATVGRDRGG